MCSSWLFLVFAPDVSCAWPLVAQVFEYAAQLAVGFAIAAVYAALCRPSAKQRMALIACIANACDFGVVAINKSVCPAREIPFTPLEAFGLAVYVTVIQVCCFIIAHEEMVAVEAEAPKSVGV